MKKLLVTIVLLVAAGVVFAQDGLYAPLLPDDTALVRVINAAGPESEPVSIDVGSTRIGPVAGDTGTAYHPVRPGVFVVFANGKRDVLTAAPATFHTILVTAGGIVAIEDQRHDDPLRSQLILYNAASTPLRLDAIVPEAPLIQAVAPGSGGVLVINAIPVTLAAVRSGSATQESAAENRFVTPITLRRGDSYALVVTERGAALAGFVVTGEVVAGTE